MIAAESAHSSQIRLEDLTAYLKTQGWVLTGHPNQKLFVFAPTAHLDRGPSEIVLPRSGMATDLPIRIEKALQYLSEVQQRPLDEILRNVKSVKRDKFETHIYQASHANRGLSITKTAALFKSFNDLLTYAVVQQKHPGPAFDKATIEARKFADSCTFTTTFEGSFGIAIESPDLEPPGSQPGQTAPLARAVFERLFLGLMHASQATAASDPALLTGLWSTGFNANLCDALASCLEVFSTEEIEIVPAWSPQWQVSAHSQFRDAVRLNSSAVPILRAASTELRSNRQAVPVTLTGFIKELRFNEGPQGLRRMIVMDGVTEHGQQYRVRTALEEREYRAACDAHRDQMQFQVSGLLAKHGKYWVIDRTASVVPSTLRTLSANSASFPNPD